MGQWAGLEYGPIYSPQPLHYVYLYSNVLCPFCLLNCFNSLGNRFNKVLGTFFRGFDPHGHDKITQLLPIY